jgi:hypothetical protein
MAARAPLYDPTRLPMMSGGNMTSPTMRPALGMGNLGMTGMTGGNMYMGKPMQPANDGAMTPEGPGFSPTAPVAPVPPAPGEAPLPAGPPMDPTMPAAGAVPGAPAMAPAGTPGAPLSPYLSGIWDPSLGTAMGDAAYKQATQYFDSDFAREDDRLRTQLANQGFAVGSEGYNNEVGNMRRTHDSARTNAAFQAQQAGFAQALGLGNLALGARGQDTAETASRYGADASAGASHYASDAGLSSAELSAQVAMRRLGLDENNSNFSQLMQLIAGARGGVPNLGFGGPTPLDVTGAYGINQSGQNANTAYNAAQNSGLYNLGATLLGSYFGR